MPSSMKTKIYWSENSSRAMVIEIIPESRPGKAYFKELVSISFVKRPKGTIRFRSSRRSPASTSTLTGQPGMEDLGEVAPYFTQVVRDGDLRKIIFDVQHLVDDGDGEDARYRIFYEFFDLGALRPVRLQPDHGAYELEVVLYSVIDFPEENFFFLTGAFLFFLQLQSLGYVPKYPYDADDIPFLVHIGLFTVLIHVSPPGFDHFSTISTTVPDFITD